MNAGLLVFILLLLLSFLGIPIFISLGIGTLIALNMADLPMLVLPQKLFAGMNSSSLLAIPFFILAGNLMSRSITGKLIDVANALIGRIKGSLALVTVVASGLFGAISGSGVATASAIGGLTIPAMKKEGYPAPFAVAVSSISSILGPIIPPSITLIVYASITNVSVSKLFIGSVIPGLLLVVCLMGYALVYAKRNNLPAHEKMPAKEVAKTFKSSIWALLMPIIILGGIYGGYVTPTEAAVLSVLYALIYGFATKEIKVKVLWTVLSKTVLTSAVVTFIISVAKTFGWILSKTRLPAIIGEAIMEVIPNKWVYLAVLMALLFLVGCLMDTIPSILILAPILVPVGVQFGLDELHLGVLFCITLTVGFITPPFGINLFTAVSTTGESYTSVVKGVIPFMIVMIICVLICAFVSPIITFLPGFMMGT